MRYEHTCSVSWRIPLMNALPIFPIKKYTDSAGKPADGIPFYPYFVIHDLVPITVFLFAFCSVLFFMPEMGGYFLEHANFEIANSLKTPEHIAPVWYFTPYYSVLRAVPDKFWGFVAFAAAVVVVHFIGCLGTSDANLFAIHNDNVIAHVHVGCVLCFVLTAQSMRDLSR